MPPRAKVAKTACKAAEDEKSEPNSNSLSRAVEKSMSEGYSHIIGLDEAGRGPLAGPVVAAACYIPADVEHIDGIADSKLLNEDGRERAFAALSAHSSVQFAYCVVSHTEIDELNILQASMTAMARSAAGLLAGLGLLPASAIHHTVSLKPSLSAMLESESKAFAELSTDCFLGLVDGNRIPKDLPMPGKFVIKGDRKIYSIAAASIVAKVVRDRIMVELDREYPVYGFAQHKGYPTAAHRALVMQHGPCEVHRRSYGPVKNAITAMEKRLGTKGAADDDNDTKRKRKSSNKKDQEAGKSQEQTQQDKDDAPVETSRRKKRKTAEDDEEKKIKAKAPKDPSPESPAVGCRRSLRIKNIQK